MIPVRRDWARLEGNPKKWDGYTFYCSSCNKENFFPIESEDWTKGKAYCWYKGCGTSYSLVFGDDGELIGVEPFGR